MDASGAGAAGIAEASGSDSAAVTTAPRDARTIEAILQAMGVEECDERVTRQLLELLYRYVWSVLDDARVYSDHADKAAIDVDDVKLAILSRVDTSFTQPPSRDVSMRAARERNAIALPPVDARAGVALPHPSLQLTAQNVSVVLAGVDGASGVAENGNEAHPSPPP
jgi:transcription initiation factor TFIID subunit 9B